MTDDRARARERSDAVKVAVRATTGAVNLTTLGAAVASGLALHSWPIFAIGGMAYGALVSWDLLSQEFRDRVLGKRPEKPTLSEPETYADLPTKAAVRALYGAKLEVDRTLASAGPEVQAHLAMALVSMEELHDRAAGLARRGESLGRYLATVDVRVVEQDVVALEQRIRGSSDEETKSKLAGALAARREHVQALVDLRHAKERIDATLLNIVATLEALPAKVVRMATLDAEAMDSLTGDVQEELATMNGEIRTFEEALRAMGEVGR